jgi:hypothetical protein
MKFRSHFSFLMVLLTLCLLGGAESALAAKGGTNYKPIKRLTALKGNENPATGTAKVYYKHSEINPTQRLQVLATGLPPRSEFSLSINSAIVDKQTSDKTGAIEFSYSSLIQPGQSGDTKPLPESIKYVLASRSVQLLDNNGTVVLDGVFDGDNGIEPQFSVPNQVIEAGKTVTIPVAVVDPDGDPITLSVACDKGNFVTTSALSLIVSPQAGDVGTSVCTVTATDIFGLFSTSAFAITVTPQNLAPTISSIGDQVVRAGDTLSVPVTASDPNGNAGLRLTLSGAPAFVSLSDNGNGTGTIRISPALTDSQGGRVTVQVTDLSGLSAQTSFNITVQKAVVITAASRAKPNLFISGVGFGSAGATVTINGQNVSAKIIGQSDNSITLKGSKKKLNLKSGPNQITVSSGGTTSNPFVLNLLAGEE